MASQDDKEKAPRRRKVAAGDASAAKADKPDKPAKKTAAKKAEKTPAKTAAAKKTTPKKAAKPAAKTPVRKAKAPTRKKVVPAEPAVAVPAEAAEVVHVAYPQSTVAGAEPHSVAGIANAVIAIHSAKYEVTPPERVVEPLYPGERVTELPVQYDETRLVLMVRDPEWLYMYWQISRADRGMLGVAPERIAESLVIRLHDITGLEEFNGINSVSWYEVPIAGGGVSWYVRLPQVDREWCAELGVLNERGEFIQICRSNRVRTPRNAIAEVMDTEWMTISEELQQLLTKSADVAVSSRLGSEAAIRQISQRLRLSLEKHEGSAGLSGSLRVRAARAPSVAAGTQLPLSVRTELILSGSTDPQAKLTVAGQPIELRPDGTFTLRFELPDGEQVLAVRATSRDETLQREITPVVRKETRAG